ncbi:EAL domain-containing protein [Pusillimonas sp. DMV24BSW_D]|uniref:putative bifunctional diguanylate cyclase/phosphodiesterase n=1 Tax=Neopusillimonas aestuarii TaxID=2716226 RepID=UPI00140D23A1|nr:EAL domain-containing protein [Pusillimonas sp. DMV24BSW_D]QIM47801.1 EAL domain-containing protein [Pusillimonas sp. DMV24BSW_D]
MLESSYNPSLVLWSLAVAVLASYTALDLASRVASSRGVAARWWLAGGACAMGLGIWSMHFVGMLAFNLPIPLGYDPFITAISLLMAIASSGYALWLVCRATLPWYRLLAGGFIMATGIASMHYTGMGAMLMQPGIDYLPSWVALSLLIAFGASVAALWLAFRLRQNLNYVTALRVGASLVMGAAIAGMHYTGMAAAQFPVGSICGAASTGVDVYWLALLTISVTLAALLATLVVSVLDNRMQLTSTTLSTSLRKATDQLEHLSLHDGLTQLPNRIFFEERLDQAIRSVKKNGGYLAVFMIDVDGFQVINDAYGRHVGDRLLVAMAQRLQNGIRAQDTLARLAGDEFVLQAFISKPDDASLMADKFIQLVQKPFQIVGRDLHISVSIGVTMCPEDGDLRETLLANADAARRHAKSSGRNTYRFFESSMNDNVYEQLRLLQDFRIALENNQLSLVYQPIYDSRGRGLASAEALLRWTHPDHGRVAPDSFIPMAERTGLIVPIGEWVLDQACSQLRCWQDAGWKDARVAVNLSAMQFSHSGLVEMLQTILDRYRIKPESLTLEITETTAMQNAETSIVILHKLRRLGVRIAIDDFGTGYSSLLYLKRLPVSELKIDRGFVHDLTLQKEDVAIVEAVVTLANKLGLSVVAEGVETPEQLDLLVDLGCDYLQGYLLGRPVHAQTLLGLVTEGTRAARVAQL